MGDMGLQALYISCGIRHDGDNASNPDMCDQNGHLHFLAFPICLYRLVSILGKVHRLDAAPARV
jgi:hypothetical protein